MYEGILIVSIKVVHVCTRNFISPIMQIIWFLSTGLNLAANHFSQLHPLLEKAEMATATR